MSTARERLAEPEKHYSYGIGPGRVDWDLHAEDVLEVHNEGTLITADPKTWPPDEVEVLTYEAGYGHSLQTRYNEVMLPTVCATGVFDRLPRPMYWWPLPGGAK